MLSSHSIVTMSRWFVGSSSNNRSGFCTSAFAKATRLCQPPDNSRIFLSAGRSSSEMTVSIRCSMCQPPCVSICRCSSSSRRMPGGSRVSRERCRYSSRSSWMPVRPDFTISRTLRSGSSSKDWASWLTTSPAWRRISPESASISPVISLNVVDLPAPLRPIRHTRSSGSIDRSASRRISCSPNFSDTLSKRINDIAFEVHEPAKPQGYTLSAPARASSIEQILARP